MKVLVSFTLIVMMLVTSCCSAGAIEQGSDTLIDSSAMIDIINTYPNEIALVENTYNVSIEQINNKNLDLIKEVAIDNLYNSNYEFSDLMTDISTLCVENNIDYYISQALPTTYAGHDGGIRVENQETREIISFGPLKGQYITEVKANSTTKEERGFSFNISSGESLKGVEIGLGVNVSNSVEISGPELHTKMISGDYATHSVGLGILYASVNLIEFDYVNDSAGGRVTHMSITVIVKETAEARDFVTLANMTDKFILEGLNGRGFLTYSSKKAFQERFEYNPEIVLI